GIDGKDFAIGLLKLDKIAYPKIDFAPIRRIGEAGFLFRIICLHLYLCKIPKRLCVTPIDFGYLMFYDICVNWKGIEKFMENNRCFFCA
ncbi:MAG: hypothetical protein IKC36_00535, partial [Clostridia bacterium]|nr:hypothetical protein [Clostridia bacterium]